ncbi:unnamed protein product, partial [Chrysoparadoxa australica]
MTLAQEGSQAAAVVDNLRTSKFVGTFRCDDMAELLRQYQLKTGREPEVEGTKRNHRVSYSRYSEGGGRNFSL